MIGSTVLSLLTMIVAFIVAIGILVSVHEYGHFWMARKVGIRVLRFAVGFGKPIWKRTSQKDGVEYVIGSIPLGGYVKMLDEREGTVAPEAAPFSYNRAPPWKRILTLLAGPFANLIFAVLAYWLLLMIGIPGFKPVVGDVTPDSIAARSGLRSDDLIIQVQHREVTTLEGVLMGLMDNMAAGTVQMQVRADMGRGEPREVVLQPGKGRRDLTEPETMMTGLGFDFWRPRLPAVIDTVVPGGAAEQAGLKVGDRITAIDGKPITDFNAVVSFVRPHMNREAVFSLQRGTETLDVTVKIGQQTRDGHSEGSIGVGVKGTVSMPDEMRALQKFGPLAALGRGVQQTWETSALSLKMMWKMLTGKVSTKNLSGPISIAEYTGVAARQGGLVFLNWLALISISIGIFNLLPIPMLDGGQIVYQLVELLKGSPVSERIQMISQQVGVAMLLMLLSLTLYNDIARHLS